MRTVQQPQQSPEEIRALEVEATFTVQRVLAMATVLYLCEIQPSFLPALLSYLNSS